MASPVLDLLFLVSLASLPSLPLCQQLYEGRVTTDCQNSSNSTSVLGYLCNGPSNSCQTYLTFHSQPPYQTPSTISALLGSDPSQVSLLNSVSDDATFPTNTKVIVPINCSCSNRLYQSYSTYAIQNGDNFLRIANKTYQGLSTCQAIQAQNPNPTTTLVSGTDLTIPLRCACPTSDQTRNRVKYLLSYLVDSGDTVFLIAQRFGVKQQSILDANRLSLHNPKIYPFTTLLIPLENQPNISQTTTPPSPLPPPTSSPSTNESPDHAGVYVGIGVGVGVLVLIVSFVLLWVSLKYRGKKAQQALHANDLENHAKPASKSSDAYEDIKSSEDAALAITDFARTLKVYEFEELQLATKNLSDECRIEGSVYRGVFKGDVAAVKKMNRDACNEIEILKKINHFNLIMLSGICFNQGHWFLVYEYAENGSLSKLIFDRSGSKVLSWAQRMQIALDVADGLNYLHSYTDPPYVHKNIKSSNILLDEKFRAKISNFSLSRPVEDQEGTFGLTRHIVGTKGYMAPEYLEHGFVSPKLDVYAFGVVMTELITGRDIISMQGEDNVLSFEAFRGVLSEEDAGRRLEAFIDPLLDGNYPKDLALIMVRLMEGCLRQDAGSRPCMGKISESLSKICDASLNWASSNSVSKLQTQIYSRREKR